ncbi:hypothetical protein PCE1_001946 [Barthelona sp. PCE]
MKNICFGTTSRWRQAFIKKMFGQLLPPSEFQLGEFYSSEFDETDLNSTPCRTIEDVQHLTKRISNEKLGSILNSNTFSPDTFVVCFDQLVVKQTPEGIEVRPKPKDRETVRRYLESYSNSSLHVVNGWSVFDVENQLLTLHSSVDEIKFKEFDQAVFNHLLHHEHILTCAGGFISEEMKEYTIKPFEEIQAACFGVPEQFFSFIKC